MDSDEQNAETTAAAAATAADRAQLIEKMVKLKRVATLYKSEGAKTKKALEDARAQASHRREMIRLHRDMEKREERGEVRVPG